MKKILLAALGLLLAPTFLMADTAGQTSEKSLYQTLKDSPWKLSLSTETFTERKENEDNISKFNSNLYPNVGYKLSENQLLDFYPKFTLTRGDVLDKNVDSYTTSTEYLALRFTQDKILTADRDGVDFKTDGRYYFLPTNDFQKAKGTDGYLNVRTYLVKKFSDEWSLDNHNRFYVYDRNDLKEGDGNFAVTKSSADFRVKPVYTFSDQLRGEVELQYVTTNADRKNADNVNLTPKAVYTLNDQFRFDLGLEFPLMDSARASKDSISMTLAPAVGYTFNDSVYAELSSSIPALDKTGKFFEANNFKKNYTVQLDLSLVAF